MTYFGATDTSCLLLNRLELHVIVSDSFHRNPWWNIAFNVPVEHISQVAKISCPCEAPPSLPKRNRGDRETAADRGKGRPWHCGESSPGFRGGFAWHSWGWETAALTIPNRIMFHMEHSGGWCWSTYCVGGAEGEYRTQCSTWNMPK
jgi:hypothetical protein